MSATRAANHTPSPVRRPSAATYLYPSLVLALAFIVKVYRIEKGNFVVWDEAHFGKFSQNYLSRRFYFDVHPPLGKLLTALSGYIAGQSEAFLFSSTEEFPSSFDYVSMRRFHALIGSLANLTLYFTFTSLNMSRLSSFLFSLLYVFENGTTSITRLILLDSHLLLFTFLTVLFLVRHWAVRRTDESASIRTTSRSPARIDKITRCSGAVSEVNCNGSVQLHTTYSHSRTCSSLNLDQATAEEKETGNQKETTISSCLKTRTRSETGIGAAVTLDVTGKEKQLENRKKIVGMQMINSGCMPYSTCSSAKKSECSLKHDGKLSKRGYGRRVVRAPSSKAQKGKFASESLNENTTGRCIEGDKTENQQNQQLLQITVSHKTLLALGASIGCAVSVKWIGCLTMLFVGLFVIYDLDRTLRTRPFSAFLHLLFLYASYLVLLPAIIYVSFFYLHFRIACNSASDDGFVSPRFQMTLKGSPYEKTKKFVSFGQQITIKNTKSSSYLHSHKHKYPHDDETEIGESSSARTQDNRVAGKGEEAQNRQEKGKKGRRNQIQNIRRSAEETSSQTEDDDESRKSVAMAAQGDDSGEEQSSDTEDDETSGISKAKQEQSNVLYQATGYSARDSNNNIYLQKVTGESEVGFLAERDRITLLHAENNAYFEAQPELSYSGKGRAVGTRTGPLSAAGVWRIRRYVREKVQQQENEIIRNDSSDPAKEKGEDAKPKRSSEDRNIRTLVDKFYLWNEVYKCYLKAPGTSYPSWGYKQKEIVCGSELDENSLWMIEENFYSESAKSDNSERIREAAGEEADDRGESKKGQTRRKSRENKKQSETGLELSFWGKLIEYHVLMWNTNKSFVQDDALEPDGIVSRPEEWPLLLRGIKMTQWGARHKFYLMFNPVTGIASGIAVVLAPVVFLVKIIARKRRGGKKGRREVDRMTTLYGRDAFFVFLGTVGWLVHYVPFFFVTRVLYVHHYFPALYFATISLVFLMRHTARSLQLCLLALAVLSYLFFSPLTYGFINKETVRTLQLLPSWDFVENE